MKGERNKGEGNKGEGRKDEGRKDEGRKEERWRLKGLRVEVNDWRLKVESQRLEAEGLAKKYNKRQINNNTTTVINNKQQSNRKL